MHGIHIPKLDRSCNSWVVSRKSDGSVIGEFFDESIVRSFHPETCVVETLSTYLTNLAKIGRVYHVVHKRTGYKATLYPMSHDKCCIFKSKLLSPNDWILIEFLN